jgi:hypothetical protein
MTATAEWIALLYRMWDMPHLNVGRETGCPDGILLWLSLVF